MLNDSRKITDLHYLMQSVILHVMYKENIVLYLFYKLFYFASMSFLLFVVVYTHK